MKSLFAIFFTFICIDSYAQGTTVTVEAKTHVQIEFRHDETGLEIMFLHFEAGKLHKGDTISFLLGGSQNSHMEYSIVGSDNTKLEKNALKIDLYEETANDLVEHGLAEIRHNGFLYHISPADRKSIAQAAKAAFRKKAARVKKQ
jgi:hypothetical protein